MSPAPNKRHQRISSKLHIGIGSYLQSCKKNCELFAAPFDVRLLDNKQSKNSDKDIYTVVQPDLCIICDESKLDDKGCIGAPDVIIEILSPGNNKKEMKIKYELYQENGVKEYWIVVPQEQFIQQFALNSQGKYELVKIYTDEDMLTTPLFPDLHVNLSSVLGE
jgi:Uma2 family endonuclease